MSTSTLDPDNDLTPDRQLGVGHDDSALGPSDSSDSGSDVKGLFIADTDTDRRGTGERSTVEMPDEGETRQDIGVDHIENLPIDDARTTRSNIEGGQRSELGTSDINEAPEDIEFEDETR